MVQTTFQPLAARLLSRWIALTLVLLTSGLLTACSDDESKPMSDVGPDGDVAPDMVDEADVADVADVIDEGDAVGDPAIEPDLGPDLPTTFEYTVLDYAPNTGTQTVFVDPTKLVTVIYELDVSGSEIGLNSQNSGLTHAPSPDDYDWATTQGRPAIVGNQETLANWTPNSVFMNDDGVSSDQAAGDDIWTIAFGYPPGTALQYKYTIGTPGADWSPTEEFPLTNRGYDVPTDGTTVVRIRDVFADEPDPSGSQGSLTTIQTLGPDDSKSIVPPAAAFYPFSSDGSEVGVVFDGPLDETTAETIGNYTLTDRAGNPQTITSATLDVDDATYVVLALESTLSNTSYDLAVSGVEPEGGGTAISGTEGVRGTALLNLVWHQHQPSYLDPGQDELQGPWVRKHAQKDYFDMTAILLQYPDVHFNVNLTSSLLNQLQLYVDRLGPYVDLEANTFDEATFFSDGMDGRTDPWIDLLLNDTPAPDEATDDELGRFYAGVWSCRSIAEPLRSFFPEYDALAGLSGETYTQLDLLYLKLWFELAWFDPDFLRGPVEVYRDGDTPVVIDLSDVVVEQDDGTFLLDAYYTDNAQTDEELLARGEALANRLVVESYKVMVGSIEIHAELLYTGSSGGGGGGQIDVLTTPFYHPILPLLYDTDLAAEGAPTDQLPTPAFSYAEDVGTQIAMAVEFYERTFGQPPRGMWPSEGAVAEEIIGAFVDSGIEYIATDMRVLRRGLGNDASHFFAYMVDADDVEGDGGSTDDELMIVFRDTPLSDKVGFAFQGAPARQNADEFLADVLTNAPLWGDDERLMSVILDGENAWEWYRQDHDAKAFHHLLYQNLSTAYGRGMVITTTGSEYIDGNEDRGIAAHPVTDLREYEDLFPASWINGSLDTWIGEPEENLAWGYLLTARADIEAASALLDITLTDPPLDPPSRDDTDAYAYWQAWHAMYAAEGSDWFWWYGADQTAAGGDDSPFDAIFRSQLVAMYTFLNQALAENGEDELDIPAFPPVLQPPSVPFDESQPFTTAPTLDGELTGGIEEWIPPAGAFWDSDSSAGVDPDDDIRRVIYGYVGTGDEAVVYIGILFDEDMAGKLGTNYRVAIYTNHGNVDGDLLTQDPSNTETEEGLAVSFRAGGMARQVAFDFSGSGVEPSVANADGEGGWSAVVGHGVQVGGPAGAGTLLEIAIPLADLGMSFNGPFAGDPLELVVVAAEYE